MDKAMRHLLSLFDVLIVQMPLQTLDVNVNVNVNSGLYGPSLVIFHDILVKAN